MGFVLTMHEPLSAICNAVCTIISSLFVAEESQLIMRTLLVSHTHQDTLKKPKLNVVPSRGSTCSTILVVCPLCSAGKDTVTAFPLCTVLPFTLSISPVLFRGLHPSLSLALGKPPS